jgi:hypothetical protein
MENGLKEASRRASAAQRSWRPWRAWREQWIGDRKEENSRFSPRTRRAQRRGGRILRRGRELGRRNLELPWRGMSQRGLGGLGVLGENNGSGIEKRMNSRFLAKDAKSAKTWWADFEAGARAGAEKSETSMAWDEPERSWRPWRAWREHGSGIGKKRDSRFSRGGAEARRGFRRAGGREDSWGVNFNTQYSTRNIQWATESCES